MLVAHIALAGCYEPALTDCTISCTGPSDCASGQVCLADGFCASPGTTRCEEGQAVTSDASIRPTDASTGDSSDTCTAAMCPNGDCVAGVCTIDCSVAGSCAEQDIRCPADVPCHVICGDNACAKKVLCQDSTACRVDCTGIDACGDEIICPADAECDVACSGALSCKKTKCRDSCSCDVTCTGTGSCSDSPECPDACRVGNGCTAQGVGCDTCAS